MWVSKDDGCCYTGQPDEVICFHVLVFTDKEEMKEMQKQMAQNDPQQMLSNLFGGGKAKGADDED